MACNVSGLGRIFVLKAPSFDEEFLVELSTVDDTDTVKLLVVTVVEYGKNEADGSCLLLCIGAILKEASLMID